MIQNRNLGDETMTEQKRKPTFESKPYSQKWLYGGLRHLDKNVDEDAFCPESEFDRIKSGEVITPEKTDAPVLMAAQIMKEALERISLCRGWYEGNPEGALTECEDIAKAALEFIGSEDGNY